jgi:hypothetical protein
MLERRGRTDRGSRRSWEWLLRDMPTTKSELLQGTVGEADQNSSFVTQISIYHSLQ